jgi:hypothetical protein
LNHNPSRCALQPCPLIPGARLPYGKIWIQENTTDVEIGKEFADLGISKQEIVVGFHHPAMREYSDYAIA